MQFDLTQNSADQFRKAINNPFFINIDKNGILIPSLSIYTVLYLSEKEPTWNEQYNKELAEFFENPNNQVTYFNLNCWTISEQNMLQLSKSLTPNITLKKLILSGNSIGDLGTRSLVSYLKENKTLTDLDISDNGIGEIGLMSIADSLTVNRTLKTLVLGGNSNFFTQQALSKLVDSLKSNKVVESISFAHGNFGGDCDTQIANLINNNTLKKIDLSHCSLGIEGAIEIAKALECNQSLECLSMAHNKIGDQGAIAIAKALTKNNSLSSLYIDLKSNNICDQGAISFADPLAKNYIWCIYFDNNNIGNSGGLAIAQGIKNRKATNNDFVFLMSLKHNEKIGTSTTETFRELCNEKNNAFLLFWVAFYDTLSVVNPF